MATGKVFHGARAKVQFAGQTVGIFTNVSFQYSIEDQEVHILGRFGPAEIALTGASAVSGTLSGWRVIGSGPFAQKTLDPAGNAVRLVPLLSELLAAEDTHISVYDRQTNELVANLVGVRTLGFSTGFQNRSLAEISIPFKALSITDEGVASNDDEIGLP